MRTAIVAVIVALSLAGCSANTYTQPNNRPDVAETRSGGEVATGPRTVVYEVTGSGKIQQMNYFAGPNDMKQVAPSNLPWRVELTLSADTPIGFSANTMNATDAKCRVLVDGEDVTHIITLRGNQPGEAYVLRCGSVKEQ